MPGAHKVSFHRKSRIRMRGRNSEKRWGIGAAFLKRVGGKEKFDCGGDWRRNSYSAASAARSPDPPSFYKSVCAPLDSMYSGDEQGDRKSFHSAIGY